MLMVGVLMYALLHLPGPLFRRGRWLRHDPGHPGKQPAPASRCCSACSSPNCLRPIGQPRLRRLGRHLLAVAVHGRHARRRLRQHRHRDRPVHGVDPVTCAIIGMAAMVGGGTGAAMTAVTMIFEMTRDYDIIMPIIVAVALAIGVRRLLSRENIYTIKLVDARPPDPQGAARQHVPGAPRRGSHGPRACWCCRRRPISPLSCAKPRPAASSTSWSPKDDRIVGVLRVNTELRLGLEGAYSGVRLGDIAQKNFTVSRAEDVVFDVVERMWRRGAAWRSSPRARPCRAAATSSA